MDWHDRSELPLFTEFPLMSDISCTIKRLPSAPWQQAARDAVVETPANAPPWRPWRRWPPMWSSTPNTWPSLTAKYWGAGGVKLTVGFLDNPPTNLRKRILSHMNACGLVVVSTKVTLAQAPQAFICDRMRLRRLVGGLSRKPTVSLTPPGAPVLGGQEGQVLGVHDHIGGPCARASTAGALAGFSTTASRRPAARRRPADA